MSTPPKAANSSPPVDHMGEASSETSSRKSARSGRNTRNSRIAADRWYGGEPRTSETIRSSAAAHTAPPPLDRVFRRLVLRIPRRNVIAPIPHQMPRRRRKPHRRLLIPRIGDRPTGPAKNISRRIRSLRLPKNQPGDQPTPEHSPMRSSPMRPSNTSPESAAEMCDHAIPDPPPKRAPPNRPSIVAPQYTDPTGMRILRTADGHAVVEDGALPIASERLRPPIDANAGCGANDHGSGASSRSFAHVSRPPPAFMGRDQGASVRR